MELTIADSVPVITVFLQGALSFFSPCVLPLLPFYIGYLSGGTGALSSEGEAVFSRKKVLLNTVCFVLGISFSFFLLGFGMRAIGRFFSGNGLLFSRIGGIVVLLFGLYQLGVFGTSSVLMREKRLPVQVDKMAMSPLTALIMGFVFSFAWTPCVGPTLSSVLLMAASAKSSAAGFVLIGVYTAGFAIPFLLAGVFTTSILSFFRRHRSVVRYTVKISGALLILMGVMMVTGFMNHVTGYLARISGTAESAAASNRTETSVVQEEAGGKPAAEQEKTEEKPAAEQEKTEEIPAPEQEKEVPEQKGGAPEQEEEASEREEAAGAGAEERDQIAAPDFTLTDQNGITHTLSEYRGKTVFLNFWATWCPPCRAEMPDIQALYEEMIEAEDPDLIILAVAFPNHGGETSEEGIREFLENNGYTYPVLMDHDASLLDPYYITAYPTTYMIDRDGNIYGYVTGSMTKDIMEDIIRQTKEAADGKSSAQE